ADRLALAGLLAATLLGGYAVDWLRGPTRNLLTACGAAVLTLAVLEAGWSGAPQLARIATAYPALDGPIAADRSGSVVVDIPFGLRGGIPLSGQPLDPRSLLLATADGHPRAITYSSWNPAPTTNAIFRHAFYAQLAAAQQRKRSTAGQLEAARLDARAMHIGWIVAWMPLSPAVSRYLAGTGFRFSYRADGVSVYRPGPVTARSAVSGDPGHRHD
ncbi:MAG: hypothetical protein ABJB47_14125, partial [Actinomycetota bacterium]